jgi:hypothetical protein
MRILEGMLIDGHRSGRSGFRMGDCLPGFLSIISAPGGLLFGLLDLPGKLGIDIPNPLILPRFVVVACEIIVLLKRLNNRNIRKRDPRI